MKRQSGEGCTEKLWKKEALTGDVTFVCSSRYAFRRVVEEAVTEWKVKSFLSGLLCRELSNQSSEVEGDERGSSDR